MRHRRTRQGPQSIGAALRPPHLPRQGMAMQSHFITAALFLALSSSQAFPHSAETRDRLPVDSSSPFRSDTILSGREAAAMSGGRYARFVPGAAESDKAGSDGAARPPMTAQQADGLHSAGNWPIKIDELMPDLYPPLAQAPITREQVKKELADAIRSGDLYHGSTGLKLNQVYPWRYRSDSNPNPVKDSTAAREHLDPPPTASPAPRTPTATQGPR